MNKISALFVIAAITVTSIEASAQSTNKDFSSWLQGVRTEAGRRGLTSPQVSGVLRDLRPIARVLELDRRQPEFTLTLDQYLRRIVSRKRVSTGRQLLRKNSSLLAEVARKYRVQPRFIVALWGTESNFGKNTGRYPVIAAIATLAHDGRRSDFFRGELFDALSILQQGHVSARVMLGSWAGAMGQCQFIPSSFLRYAVDHNGDGRRDIWNTRADVFASTANYLLKAGWKDDQTWGRKVRLPAGFDRKLATLKVRKKISTWQKLGVRRANGRDLPKRDLDASLILPGKGADSQPYLIYNNYRSLLRWNRSHFFAVSIGLLSDRIADP